MSTAPRGPAAPVAMPSPGPVPQLTPDTLPQPFGARLFTGAFAGRGIGEAHTRQIAIGDRISVQLWGGAQAGGIQTVDPAGNIFVPEVGPVRVAGIPASALQGTVQAAVQSVFTEAVQVYAAPVDPGGMGVFVTGAVARPGRYSGSAQDNLLYFLDRAGGVDLQRGSFRDVRVLRGSRVIARADLYDFLTAGALTSVAFREGDVIFVGDVGPSVAALGLVINPARFEFAEGGMRGADLIALARPTPDATHVAVATVRGGRPEQSYFSLAEFASRPLVNGEIVSFVADTVVTSIMVRLDANVSAQKSYVLPRDATLVELLAVIPVDNPRLDLTAVHLRRVGVARQQKAALEDGLARLERTAFLAAAAAPTPEVAAGMAREAQAISSFAERARDVTPTGIVVVADESGLQNITLADGDVIVIPERTDVVMVVGEVVSPGAFTVRRDFTVRDYVEMAGGLGDYASDSDFVVRRMNGTAIVVDEDYVPRPGDQIVILPEIGNQSFQLAKDIMQIIFQIALTTATILRI